MRRCVLVTLLAALAVAATSAGAAPARVAGVPAENAGRTVVVLGPAAAHAAAKHGEIRPRLPLLGGVSAVVRGGELRALAAEPGVTRVALDRLMVKNGSTGTSSTPATTYPIDDDVQRAYDWGYTGAGVGIAVIDSGVGASPDFGSRLVQVQLGGQTGPLDDAHGHGTLVAGIAAGSSADGRFKGIAPGSTIYAINASRNGTSIYSTDVITALNWVFENAHTYNIRVVNLSVSESTPSSYKNSLLDLAVERLWASGVLVVVAAGNTGAGAGSLDYAPANDPLAIAVGGMDDKGTTRLSDDDVASFSAGGLLGTTKTMDGFAKPDILAPGRLIASILKPGTLLDSQAPAANRVAPGYAKISGTSFAAPQVAGAAAIEFQMHPDWSPDAVKYTLLDRARIVKSGSIKTLDVGATVNIWSPMGLANQGVAALVCHPGAACLTGTSIASIWDSSTWSSSTWSSSTWSSSTWSSSTWSSSTWSSSTWSSSTWSGTSDWSYMTWQ